MKKNILLFTLIFLIILNYSHKTHALDPTTHQQINEYVATNTLNEFSLDNYLKTNLGFSEGKDEFVNGKRVLKWIKDGGLYEDIPTWILTYLRSVNHFHDPLLDQGYSGPWYTFGFLSGLSSTQWMLLPPETQSPGGYYSWHDVRNYYYKALTSHDQDTRNTYFTETFRGLGQLMHLIQDASVPAHTRNDFHALYNYDKWVKANEDGIFKHNPIFFNGIINNAASVIDTNQYNGTNPGITTSATMGISEYTNANFFSEDTINASNFPYPQITEGTPIEEKEFTNTFWDETYPRMYYLKDCCGETNNGRGYLLSAVDYLDYYRREYPYLSFLLPKIPVLDDNVYNDYASFLLPRAIGYSAGLLSYFFRGELEVVRNTYPDSITITNNSSEKMDGIFTLYYDAADDARKPVTDGSWSLALEPGNTSDELSFTEPTDLDQDKPYILVFKGTLGSESNAVVGKIGFCTEEFKLTASNAAAGDEFGISVAISGNVAIIGASGSAYIFVRNGDSWQEQAKLTASDAAAGDFFGWSVAINGDVAIVGADEDDDAGDDSGSAYVFIRNGDMWEEKKKLTASDATAGDRFGWSVAIGRDVAIVGSTSERTDFGDWSGSAYIKYYNGCSP